MQKMYFQTWDRVSELGIVAAYSISSSILRPDLSVTKLGKAIDMVEHYFYISPWSVFDVWISTIF